MDEPTAKTPDEPPSPLGEPGATLRVLQPAVGVLAFYDGRIPGRRLFSSEPNWIDDGAFELIALGATSKLGFAMTSGSIYSGEHINHVGTLHLRAQKVKLDLVNADAKPVFLLDVDGEPMGGLPLEIEVVPKAMTLRG